jgi:hypothetical protein
VSGQRVSEPLLLRALRYFDDAEAEAPIPGEGPHDWAAVKDFFLSRVGSLLVPADEQFGGRPHHIQWNAEPSHRNTNERFRQTA